MALLVIGAAGCQQPETRFQITNYPIAGPPEHFQARFDECYYRVEKDGNVDVLARRHREGADTDAGPITQIIHLRTEFRAVPGTTYVERTMINALVTYVIVTGSGGASFEGAGFLTCKEKRNKGLLTGDLELSRLHPLRQVGEGVALFDRAELIGEFSARRNRKQVIRLLNELNRVFGPQPRYQPPPDPM